MWQVAYWFMVYFLSVCALYGFVWCTRKVSRWYHYRSLLKGFREQSKYGRLDKIQSVGRIKRNLTKLSKWQ